MNGTPDRIEIRPERVASSRPKPAIAIGWKRIARRTEGTPKAMP